MSLKINSMYLADGYKVGHYNMYQDGAEVVYSNFTPRSNKFAPKGNNGKVLNFGQQYAIRFIVEHFNENFFNLPKEEVIQDIKTNFSAYLGVDYDTKHIEELHDLGYLPLEIRTLEEGTESTIKIPVLFLYNTNNKFAWVTNYIETILSNLLWQPITTATNVLLMKRIVKQAVLDTDKDNLGIIDFMLHDFSMRGLTGLDAAIGSGLAFASVSKGSDSLPVIQASKHYYGETETPVFSVRASEHSQMTAGGVEGEFEIYKNLLTKFPNGILSLVSDSFDLWRVLTDYLPKLKDLIMSRDGKLVIRPDCYSEDTLILTPDGWKEFNQLTPNSLVAQVNEDGSYSFVKPLKIVNEEYNGTMFHFKDFHGKMDLLVTPNHRMVYKQFDKWKVDFAEDCKPNNYTKSFIRSAKAENKYQVLTNVERLNIAFQADGSKCTDTDKNIRFNFSKIRKIQRLKALLDEMKLSYKEYNLGDGRIEINVEYPLEHVSKNFDWVVTSDLCSNWCQEFIEELSHWDSCVRDENRIKFDTTNFSVSQVVELIALSAGYGCLTSKYEDDRKEIFSDVYTSHILLDNKLGGQSINVEEIQYNGRIVCVTVPTGKIVVKRNRCTMVCGNSGDPVDIICGKLPDYLDFDNLNEDSNYESFSHFIYEEYGNNITGKLVKIDGKFYKLGDYKYFIQDYGWDNGLSEIIQNTKQLERNGLLKKTELPNININEQKGVIELLWDIFGGTINEQGYKVLDSHIGMIYGEAINQDNIQEIFSRLKSKGFAATNCFFGQGSFSMQYVTRDTWGMALKCVAQQKEGKLVEIFKDPITDGGMKKSAKGLTVVYKNENKEYYLKDQATLEEVQSDKNELKVRFKDGNFYNQTTLTEIRNRVNI